MNEKIDKLLPNSRISTFFTNNMALHEMFALMSNIPENETDNFTAKKLAPAYLAL
jgi:hypothetical protein